MFNKKSHCKGERIRGDGKTETDKFRFECHHYKIFGHKAAEYRTKLKKEESAVQLEKLSFCTLQCWNPVSRKMVFR